MYKSNCIESVFNNRIIVRVIVFVSVGLASLLISSVFTGVASAADGDPNRFLPSTASTYNIVSSNTSPGSFYNPVSYSYLYVPSTVGRAVITLETESGSISSMSINSANTPTCSSYGRSDDYVVNPNVGSFIDIPNNIATQTITNGATTYNVHCVQVYTSTSSNVFFSLSTANNGSLLGTYPGGGEGGTGYAHTSAPGGYNSGILFDQRVSFSPPCEVSGNPNIELYDLDMYNSGGSGIELNPNVRVRLSKINKETGAQNYVSLTGDIGSDLGGNTYKPVTNATLGDVYAYAPGHPEWGPNPYGSPAANTSNNVIDSTESSNPQTFVRPLWNIRISGENYDSDFKYIIEVTGIRNTNLIRIKVPYDQINSVITCKKNDPPTVTVSVACNNISATANGTLSAAYTATDADGDTVTATASGSLTGTHTGNSHTFSGAVARRAASYSVTVSVDDGNGGTASDTGTATCDLPAPPVLTITGTPSCSNITYSFTDPSGEGFRYDVVLSGPGPSSVTDSNILAGNGSFPEVVEWRDFRANSFTVTATNRAITSQSDSESIGPIGPCVRTICGGITVTPTLLEVGRPFTLRPSFITKQNYPTSTDNTDATVGPRGQAETYNVNITIAPAGFGRPANPVVSGATLNNSSTNPLNYTVGGFTAPAVQTQASISYGLDSTTSNNADANCPAITIQVSKLPYIQTFNAPVIAGYGMKDESTGQCQTNASGVRSITGTTLTNPNEYVGSGSQMAVFALGAVNGFRSAITETSMNSQPWRRVFANSSRNTTQSPIVNDLFGGNLDTSLCAEDWLHDQPASAVVPPSSVDLTTVRGLVRYSGDVRFNATGPITGSKKIFVDGDAIIGGAASSNSFVYETNWNSVYDIPSVVIVATGNLYIDDDITALDGIFVSRDTIFTCAPSMTTLPTSSMSISAASSPATYVNGTCYNTSLTINGALIANNVRLWRTGGTLAKAYTNTNATESDSTGSQAFRLGLTGAETIRLSPEIYIAPRFGEDPTNGSVGKKNYDSLISLPPPF